MVPISLLIKRLGGYNINLIGYDREWRCVGEVVDERGNVDREAREDGGWEVLPWISSAIPCRTALASTYMTRNLRNIWSAEA
jgi:hypothetical protein